MRLKAADQARLASLLKKSRALELSWPTLDRHSRLDLGSNSLYQELTSEIAALIQAEDERLKRLADTAVHFHAQVSLAHFYGCIVPFERLANRALRDDEFLILEHDGARTPAPPVPVKIVVENLRSAFNVGALFRTAECLGVSEVILCGYTPGPDDGEILKTSMGTSALLPWRRVDRALTACAELRTQGYQLVALETARNATSLYEADFANRPVAFVLGNERFGVESETLRAVDSICQIPMRGLKNSMNVGVAFGICAFEWLRQNGVTS